MVLERTDVRPAQPLPRVVLDRAATDAAIRRLDDPERWPGAAAALVAELGFRLIEAHPATIAPDGAHGFLESHLIVAFRERPTLRHFDPESIVFYGPCETGAELRSAERLAPGDARTTDVSWGHLQVVDRVPVENRFLTFGGALRIAAVDASLTIAHLRSPVPIVRWGGHSQGTDGLAEAIGAFFGRLIVPVDFVPGAALRIDTCAPEIIFTAFVADAVRRLDAAADHPADPSELDRWLRAAWARLRPETEWRTEAEELLTALA